MLASPRKVMSKPKVLVATTPAGSPLVEGLLAPHAELVCVNTLADALAALRSHADIAMVVCGVHFDESRMYDLLEFARRRLPEVPFVCVRARQTEISRISRQSIAIATKALGAVEYMDFAAAVAEIGRKAAEQRLTEVFLRQLVR
jgi:CheY-like chemotaxis protein